MVVRLFLILLLALGVTVAPQGAMPSSAGSAAHGLDVPYVAKEPGHAHDSDQTGYGAPDHVHEAMLPRAKPVTLGTLLPVQAPLRPTDTMR